MNLMFRKCYIKILLNLNPSGKRRINYYMLYIIYIINICVTDDVTGVSVIYYGAYT